LPRAIPDTAAEAIRAHATVEENKYNLQPLPDAAVAKCNGRLATTTVETFPDNPDMPRVSPEPPRKIEKYQLLA